MRGNARAANFSFTRGARRDTPRPRRNGRKMRPSCQLIPTLFRHYEQNRHSGGGVHTHCKNYKAPSAEHGVSPHLKGLLKSPDFVIR